ncbi:2-dehydropantoate 2-reductase [Enterobacter hormaechei]|uniref:ketopantoate reductase family protein n=1 Tax=Enterobacter hormaechei TaxID=158836 RepID=UPI0037532E18
MKIAIMGTGGVGGYFGAKLAHGGSEVHFIARGKHFEAIRDNGLRVRSPLGDIHLQSPSITDTAAEVGLADVVIFGVKLWDTESAAQAIRSLVGPNTMVISLQNGVAKDEILKSVIGQQAVVGGVCYVAAGIEDPGIIGHYGKMQKLVFGEYSGDASSRVEGFLQACLGAGIDAELSTDINRVIWEKFVFLVGLSAATASTRRSIGVIRNQPEARRMLEAVMQEAVNVGMAEGVQLEPDYAQNRLQFCDQLPADMTASMLRDLEKGSRLEIPWLSGDVARRGIKLGIATPYNQAIFDILSVHANGQSIK